jgi:hypothetical protein
MSNDKQYPYGYQLSFSERLKLRLKKINYRLSLGLAISFFILSGIALLLERIFPDAAIHRLQDYLYSLAFLLLGFQGMIWVIAGEMKKLANLTSRGKSVKWLGLITWAFCWYLAVRILL